MIRIKLHFPTALCCPVKGEVEVGALAMLQGVLVVPFFVELDFLRPGEPVCDGDFLLVVLLLLILLLVGVFLIGDAQIAQQGLKVVAGALWKMIVQKFLQVVALIDFLDLTIRLNVVCCRPQLHHLVPRHAALVVVFWEVVEIEGGLIFQGQKLNRFCISFFVVLDLNFFVSDLDCAFCVIYRAFDRSRVVLFFIKDQLDNRDSVRTF